MSVPPRSIWHSGVEPASAENENPGWGSAAVAGGAPVIVCAGGSAVSRVNDRVAGSPVLSAASRARTLKVYAPSPVSERLYVLPLTHVVQSSTSVPPLSIRHWSVAPAS